MEPRTTGELGKAVKKENGNMEDASIDELCDSLSEVGMYAAQALIKDDEIGAVELAKDYDRIHFALRYLLAHGKLNFNDFKNAMEWANSI